MVFGKNMKILLLILKSQKFWKKSKQINKDKYKFTEKQSEMGEFKYRKDLSGFQWKTAQGG